MGRVTGGDGYSPDIAGEAAEALVDGYPIDTRALEPSVLGPAPEAGETSRAGRRGKSGTASADGTAVGDLDADVAEEALNRVADIADRARQRNLDRAVELADFVRAAEHGDLSPEDCEEAADVAHQLAGSAGTFGYLVATELARRIERTFLEGEPDGGDDVQESVQESVQELIQRLHQPPDVDDL
jgi:HPt (histidine-containing phosphotransfer) domain-containing protein